MKNYIFVLIAIGILAALHFYGIILANNISHPAWNSNAVMFGGMGGAIVALVIVWATSSKPGLAQAMASIINVAFIASLLTTLYFAKRFINAENFDLFAADIWHWSSYATIASFVPQVTQLLKMIFSKG